MDLKKGKISTNKVYTVYNQQSICDNRVTVGFNYIQSARSKIGGVIQQSANLRKSANIRFLAKIKGCLAQF